MACVVMVGGGSAWSDGLGCSDDSRPPLFLTLRKSMINTTYLEIAPLQHKIK